MTIDLSKGFSPFETKHSVQFESFMFSGGEPHIRILSSLDAHVQLTITHRLNSFNDLGLLCIAVDAVRRMNVKLINLFIPYFPAARQDRVMVKGEALSVKVYADIINALQLNKVIVFDPHSEVTPALLNNCEVVSNHAFIKAVIKSIGNEVKLISPDGGALKKVYKLSQYLGGAAVIECSKSRDVTTGQLSGFRVYTDDLQGMDCLVVDDICDGGGTFIGLAEELKKKNAGNLYLAISHGIFSKGFDELAKYFKYIFTTDSIKETSHSNVKQILLQTI